MTGPTPDPQLTNRGVKYPEQSPSDAVAVLAAGVDWLTCTSSEPAKAELLQARGWLIVYAEAEAGNDLRPWTWKGYDGIASGSAAVGVRYDGVICRLSAHVAADNWLGCVDLATNVSRLDLAVTVHMPDGSDPSGDAYQAEEVQPHLRGRRVADLTNIRSKKGGATTYIGSRHSERFGRIYNKEVESRDERYRGCWRWEVEYKGRAAKAMAREIPSDGNQATAVLAFTWDQFQRWGHPPLWGVGAWVPSLSLIRQRTDDESRLKWLATQVRPTVARLLAKGERAAVLAALGLHEPIGG